MIKIKALLSFILFKITINKFGQSVNDQNMSGFYDWHQRRPGSN
jgi:hypothetical protein